MSDCPECGMRDDDWFLCRREPCAINKTKRDGDRIADLERQIAELREQSDRFCDKYLAALKRAEAAEAENARLRALPFKDEVERVLEPFDNLASVVFYVDENGRELNGTKPDDQPLWGFDRVDLTYGHLRAVRALLSRLVFAIDVSSPAGRQALTGNGRAGE